MCEYTLTHTHTHTLIRSTIYIYRDTQKVGRSTNLRRTSKTVMDLSRARIRSNTHARSRIGRPYSIYTRALTHNVFACKRASAHTHTHNYVIFIYILYAGRMEERLSKLSGNLSKYRIPEMIHGPWRARNLKFSRERCCRRRQRRVNCCFIVRVDRDFCQLTI